MCIDTVFQESGLEPTRLEVTCTVMCGSGFSISEWTKLASAADDGHIFKAPCKSSLCQYVGRTNHIFVIYFEKRSLCVKAFHIVQVSELTIDQELTKKELRLDLVVEII